MSAKNDYYHWREAQIFNGTIIRKVPNIIENPFKKFSLKEKVKGDPIPCKCSCNETFPFDPKSPYEEFKNMGHKEKYWADRRRKKYLEKKSKKNGV